MTIISAGLEGLRRAEARLEVAAKNLASLPAPEASPDLVDLSAEVVALLAARTQYAAAADILRAGSEIEQHILDVLG